MNYEELEIIDSLTSKISKHIILDLGDGAYKSFPADESNSEYVAFLKSLETDNQ